MIGELSENTSGGTRVLSPEVAERVQKVQDAQRKIRLAKYLEEGGNVLQAYPEALDASRNDPYGLTMMVAGSTTLGKTYQAEATEAGTLNEDAASIPSPFDWHKGRSFKKKSTNANERSWRAYPVKVPDHAALANYVDEMQHQDNACFVRCAPHHDFDLTHLWPRRWHDSERRDGKPGGILVDRAGFWLPADGDGWPMPKGMSYADPEALIEYVCREVVPEAVRNVTCVYQFSPSAAITATNVINVHLWYLSLQAITCRQWHSISKGFASDCPGWDASAAVGTQVLFTAAPKVTDDAGRAIGDPLGLARVGIFIGTRGRVDLEPLVAASKERAARIEARQAEQMKLARERAATLDGDAIVNGYMRAWAKIADTTLGDGPGRKGYNSPLFAMACAAVKNGETDIERFSLFFKTFVTRFAEQTGETVRARGKNPEAYLVDDEVTRMFENATRAVLFAGSEDHE